MESCASVTGQTRWYPWGIQRLVSTYSNRHREGGAGVFWKVKKKPKCQDLPKFQWGGGGVLESQIPKCQDLESQIPKCQDLPKFQFSGGGVFWKVKT